jgi:hypothetical protein
MKKAVFRAKYRDVEELKKKVRESLNTAHEIAEMDSKIDKAKIELENEIIKAGKKTKKAGKKKND